ncbi:AAA family ATPase [Pseudomonas sediminis]|uniref:AAA family ATPase n=1 Tax=Pseudomonas sediminis TaxID=1691904 RepID=UPI001FB60868|nr:AAA family ATPase [Pseudomonas sediminis]
MLAALAQKGQNVVEEAGREIIRDQQAIAGLGLPWHDPRLFAELMLAWELRAHRQALTRKGPVFFDRSLVDIIGYLRLNDLPVGEHLLQAVRQLRYQRQVFLLPHWPQIYRNDHERRQDAAEAERTCAVMREAYVEATDRGTANEPGAAPRLRAAVQWPQPVASVRKRPGVTPVKRRNTPLKCAWS